MKVSPMAILLLATSIIVVMAMGWPSGSSVASFTYLNSISTTVSSATTKHCESSQQNMQVLQKISRTKVQCWRYENNIHVFDHLTNNSRALPFILHDFLYSPICGSLFQFPSFLLFAGGVSMGGLSAGRRAVLSYHPQLPPPHLNSVLLHLAKKQIFSLTEFKIKLIYWQISTTASQVFILKIIIFNSSWLISLKLKLVLWQLGIISQMPVQDRAGWYEKRGSAAVGHAWLWLVPCAHQG